MPKRKRQTQRPPKKAFLLRRRRKASDRPDDPKVSSLPTYRGAKKVWSRADKTAFAKKSLVVLAVLSVLAAGAWFGYGKYKEANPDPFSFGEGPIDSVAVSEQLSATTEALLTDDMLEAARTSGDPYTLAFRLASWNPEGWYRVGAASTEAWGVDINEAGDVFLARASSDGKCEGVMIRFYNTGSRLPDGSLERTPLDEPQVRRGQAPVALCDPTQPGHFDWR